MWVAWAADGASVSSAGLPYTEHWESGASLHFTSDAYAETLVRRFVNDVRFTPIVVVDRYGTPVLKQRRLVQSSKMDGLNGLRAYGYDAMASLLVADLDLENHAYRRLNKLQFRESVARLRGTGYGCYSSRAGLRVLKQYEDMFVVEEYHARNTAFQAELKTLLGDLFLIDSSSDQWTRLYRTPHCRRDGDIVEPWIWLDEMQPYELEQIDPTLLVDCCVDSGRDDLENRAASDQYGLDRATAYIRAVTPPRCGAGKCRQELWNVALQTHLFGLCYPDALTLVREWASRSAHPRREWTDRVIEETLHRAHASPYHKSGARLDFVSDVDTWLERDLYDLLE